MANRVIDEFPTMREVEEASNYQLVCWNHYLRPVMSNDELPIVKAIAQRYDRINIEIRAGLVIRARAEYERQGL